MSLTGPDSADPRTLLADEEEAQAEAEATARAVRERLRDREQEIEGEASGSELGSWALRRADIDELVSQALSAELPRRRALKSYEPDKLNPHHIEMIFMRACGLRPGRIAQLTGFTNSTVSVVLGHPDARYILGKILSYAADEVIDVESRLQAMAPEAVDTLADVMREGKPETRAKVAFGILDRTGHGKEIKTKVTHEISVPAKHAGLLTAALEESEKIEDADYVIVGEAGSVSDSVEASAGVSAPPTNGSQPKFEPGDEILGAHPADAVRRTA